MSGTATESSSVLELFLGPESRFEGKLKAGGNVRCDGYYDGEMSIKGSVFVGPTGRARVNLIAKRVGLAGELRGQVMTDRFDWHGGAYFQGNLLLNPLRWSEL